MGYRSEVCLAIMKDTYKEKATAKLKAALAECDSISETEEAYYFHWDEVKWYEDYDEVKVVDNFVSENKETCGLLIIGEEEDDIQREGNTYDFALYVSRSISKPNGEEIDSKDFFACNAVKFIKDIPEKKS